MQLWIPDTKYQHSAGSRGTGSAGWAWGVGTILLATKKPLVRTPVPVCPGTILPYAALGAEVTLVRVTAGLMRFFVCMLDLFFP